jgi:CheY-like chemotaxis protein
VKLQITCPGCKKGYVLDGDAAGTEFTCPGCMTRCKIGVPASSRGLSPAPSPPPVPAPDAARVERPAATSGNAPAPSVSPAPAAAGTASPGAAAAAAAKAPEPAQRSPAPAAPQTVVCPRCNLHFKLRGQASFTPDADRPRVLIVEEEGFFRQTATDALETHCEIETAGTVPEAEAILSRGGVDLMVLDITLDGGQGKRLLRQGVYKPCPILIYTARDVSEMYGQAWEELQSLGADDIVFQGLNVAESLSRKAAALLDQRWDVDDEVDAE